MYDLESLYSGLKSLQVRSLESQGAISNPLIWLIPFSQEVLFCGGFGSRKISRYKSIQNEVEHLWISSGSLRNWTIMDFIVQAFLRFNFILHLNPFWHGLGAGAQPPFSACWPPPLALLSLTSYFPRVGLSIITTFRYDPGDGAGPTETPPFYAHSRL